MFCSFVQGELQRIQATNMAEPDRETQRLFFVHRLAEQGYPKQWVSSQLQKHFLKQKPVTTRVFVPEAPAGKPVFVKLIFDRSFCPKQVARLFNRHRHKLPFQCSIRIAGVANVVFSDFSTHTTGDANPVKGWWEGTGFFRKNATKHGGRRVFVSLNETYFRSKLVVEQPILNGLRSAKRAN